MKLEKGFGCIVCTCRACGNTFRIPRVSDFSYGDFIVHTTRGDSYAYLNAFENPAFEEVSVLVKQRLDALQLTEMLISDRFQHVFGSVCDPLDGIPLDLYAKPTCPKCLGADLAMKEAVPFGQKFDIEVVSCCAWTQLSASEKAERVERVLRERGLL